MTHHPLTPPLPGLATSWQHQATECLLNPVLPVGPSGNVKSCNWAAHVHFGLKLATRSYAEPIAPESTEGTETAAQLEQLKKLGSEYGKGYLFAEPLTPMATEVFVAAQAAEGEV